MRICLRCDAALPGREWHCSACGWEAPVRDGVAYLVEPLGTDAGAFTTEQAHSLAGIDPRHFWYAARSELIAWAIGRHAAEAGTLLEVGCGTGLVLRALAEAHPQLRLTGAELSPDGLEHARRAVTGAELICADVRRLPFDGEFDIVGAFDVLEHIADDQAALRALARAARPGGTVLLTVPQHPALWTPLDSYSGHHRRYRRTQLLDVAERVGLQPRFVTSFVSLLFPGLLLSRLMQRHIDVKPGREFELSGGLNGLAMAMMRLELALIRGGLSFPAGGSLLLVAQRP